MNKTKKSLLFKNTGKVKKYIANTVSNYLPLNKIIINVALKKERYKLSDVVII